MNLKELTTERDAAGAAYVKAIESLREAFVRLAVVERTLRNAHVAPGLQIADFHRSKHQLGTALQSLQHSEFCPRLMVNHWHEPIVPASDKQIEEFTS